MEKFNVVLSEQCLVHRKKSFGFTLLELLVVIAIIGILTSVGMVSYASVQQKTRDSRRAADMKAIQNAQEQFYASSSRYPNSGEKCEPGIAYLPGGNPKDPKTGIAYTVTCDAQGLSYCVCATLENLTGGNSANANCGFGTPAGFQCAKNLQ